MAINATGTFGIKVMAQFNNLATLLLRWLPLITKIPILTKIPTILFLNNQKKSGFTSHQTTHKLTNPFKAKQIDVILMINTAITSQLDADSSELDKGAETASCVVSLTPKNSNSSDIFPDVFVVTEVVEASNDYSKRNEIKVNTARVRRWTPH